MKILSITGIGSEILKAINERSKQTAQEHNIRQALEYLKYAMKSGDATLIEYAKRKLNEIRH